MTFVGSDGDTSKQFTILVVVADPPAVKAIKAYLANGLKTNTYPGLARLPAGATSTTGSPSPGNEHP